jgi:EpsI family protein
MPQSLLGLVGRDIPISAEEQRIAGMSSFVLRFYGNPAEFSVYVGYYETQSQGRSIHSPKNCLPGAGWDPLSSGTVTLSSASGPHRVNRYVLANGNATALVYYWYQGRGRVQASEYAVKWDLLRDKAVRGRSEEALVRIVVPIERNDVAAADNRASRLGAQLVDEVQKHLPEFPGRPMAGG